MNRRIRQDGADVVLRDFYPYTLDESGECERRFWVPPSGGYVREVSASKPGTLGIQVCRYLDNSGYTISATPDTLIDVIRKEYRARERRERRGKIASHTQPGAKGNDQCQ